MRFKLNPVLLFIIIVVFASFTIGCADKTDKEGAGVKATAGDGTESVVKDAVPAPVAETEAEAVQPAESTPAPTTEAPEVFPEEIKLVPSKGNVQPAAEPPAEDGADVRVLPFDTMIAGGGGGPTRGRGVHRSRNRYKSGGPRFKTRSNNRRRHIQRYRSSRRSRGYRTASMAKHSCGSHGHHLHLSTVTTTLA